jgi:protein CpxP
VFTTKSKWRRALLFGGIPVLAAGLFFTTRAYAGGWGGCHGRHHGMAQSAEDVRDHMSRKVEWIMDELDASDAQRKQVDGIVAKRAPEFFELMKQGRAVRGSLKDALLADQVDTAKVAKAQADLDALADRASDLGVDTLLQVAQVLTPAQRKQVAEHLANMHH